MATQGSGENSERSDALGTRLRSVRRATMALAARLSPEDAMVQSMPDASPAKWHLAHTTWFFEAFVLSRVEAHYKPFHEKYGYLFNSYYEAVGARHPRPQRGLLTRPSLEEVMRYRAQVDERLEAAWPAIEAEVVPVVELGIAHEEQHQELLLTDLKHAFSTNPLLPAYATAPPRSSRGAVKLSYLHREGGVLKLGAPRAGFAFDNERPRHEVLAKPYALASRACTCGEWLGFMEDGGYQRPELWLSDGWAAVQRNGWEAPLYWQRDGGRWAVFTLGGLVPLDEASPVVHVSFYEADAFARYSGVRLPTEGEWESAAFEAKPDGTFLEDNRFHPAAATREEGFSQILGDVWEWTQSAYSPYPGFHPLKGALGEYNGKFMVNQIVLRGGSCATPREHIRASYRNFFPPEARWQFNGVRLARDS